MRDYAKVSPRFWIGETGRQIRAAGCHAQVLSFYLMTSPHANMLGLYYMPIPFIVHETGIPLEGASKALQSLKNVGFCSYDEATEFVWVHEMARFQIADNLKAAAKPGDREDNRIKGINSEYNNLPNNPFLEPFFNRYKEAFKLTGMRSYRPPKSTENEPPEPAVEPVLEGLGRGLEGASEGLRSQEQEQEHIQEQEQNKKTCAQPAQAPSDALVGADGQVDETDPVEDQDAGLLDDVADDCESATPERTSCASRFVEFWNTYPLKKGKKAAFAIWKRRKLDRIADLIIADVKRRMAEDRRWKKGYVPYGSTYISGEQWEDEIEKSDKVNSTAKYVKPVTKADFAATDYASGATKPEDDPDWFRNAGRIPH